jgi:protein-S-isoprenylcysteine O-methyltransferase Ste14
MIAWLNFAALLTCSVLFSLFYVRSVSPAALEKKLGPVAYQRCAGYRTAASLLMLIASASYVIYYWFPLPLPIPRTFPWEWTTSAALAVLIAVPSLYLMYRGIKDAGEETMRPRKEHRMYGGIYQKIRHPQALGELPLWWVLALLVHSPFLALFSFIYVPVWYWWCRAEERDLLIRHGEAYREYMDRVGFWLPRRATRRAAWKGLCR